MAKQAPVAPARRFVTLPIRDALLGRERDTYLTRVPPQESLGDRVPSSSSAAEILHPGPIDCNLGFSQWGPSPRAAAAFRDFDVEAVSRYPERFHDTLLKPAILDRFAGSGLGAGELFLGHGSFNLLERLIHKFLRPDRMIGVGPQFVELPSEFKAAGGTYETLPLVAERSSLPVEALEAAIERRSPSIVYIDNPNNPTGQAFPLADMARLAGAAGRSGAVLLVDEALGDFVADSESSIHLVASHPNVIVTRSFSKALGLAAERVGYMFMSRPLAALYRKVDVPFEPGIIAATLAACTLRDHGFIGFVRSEVRWIKAQVVHALGEAGLTVLPTHDDVSILTVHAPSRNIVEELRTHGILGQAGSSFARTHPRWDDSYCRVRLVHRTLVPQLCERILGLARRGA
jgi:histidinol-phosphate aminotransferase